jgi:hypothetical protein
MDGYIITFIQARQATTSITASGISNGFEFTILLK